MKNLNKRTQIVLAIVGIIVVIAVIGLVITQPPTSELLGTTALVITPSNPTIIIGDSIVLSVNSVYNCNWFTSSTVVASFVGDSTEVKSVTVKGNAEGLVTINANCGLINVNKAMTIVTVNRPPTPTPTPPPPSLAINPGIPKQSTTIGRGEWLALCTSDSSVRWSIVSANPADAVSLEPGPIPGWGATGSNNCGYVIGSSDGTATIRATNGAGGVATVPVTVSYPLTMIPSFNCTDLKIGQSTTLAMAGATSSTTWAGQDPNFGGITLSATTGQTVTVTGHVQGSWWVAATNPTYGMGVTRVCVVR